MASLLASLLIKLGLDAGELKSGLSIAERDVQRATKRIEKIGNSMVNIGTQLSMAVTLPMMAMAGMAVQGALDQRAAIAQVETAITSMGNAAGRTSEQLAKNADALEMNSLVDADVILTKVTANLLTFGNVAGEVFDRAQQAAIDMAQRLGSDPQAAAVMLGKALNDPIRGITALTRVGVQFTAAQKAQIEAFMKTGQAAKAQGIILTEVERQFKGAAKAAADTSPWRQATVAINQAGDALGEAILPIIPPVTAAIVAVAQAFAGLSPEMQNVALISAVVAAAFGPILVGVGTLTTALAGKLVSALVAYRAGLLATAAAQGIAATASNVLAVALRGLLVATGVGVAITALAGAIYLFTRETKDTAAASADLKVKIGTAEATLRSYDNQLRAAGVSTAALTQVSAAAKGKVDGLAASYNKASVEAHRLATQSSLATIEILKQQAALSSASKVRQAGFERDLRNARYPSKFVTPEGAAIDLKPRDRVREAELARLIAEEKKLQRFADETQEKAKLAGSLGIKLRSTPPALPPVNIPAFDAGTKAVDRASNAVRGIGTAAQGAKQAAEELQAVMDRLFPEVAAQREFEKQLKLIEQSKLAEEQRVAAVRALRREYMGLARDRVGGIDEDPTTVLDSQSGQSVEEMSRKVADRASDALSKVGKKAEATRVQVVESFTQMIDGALSQLDRFVRGIKSGNWLDIIGGLLSAIDGIAAAFSGGKGLSLGPFTFGDRGGGVPGYANGTNFHPGGLAVVGERGPELLNLPRGSQVRSNRELMAAGGGAQRSVVEIVDTTGLFRFRVGEQILETSPAIMDGGAKVAASRLGYRQTRRVG